MSGLPRIYTLSPRASGVYIRQTMSAYGVTTMHVTLPCINHAKQLKPY